MCRALIKHERLRCKPESRALNGIWRSQLVGGVSIIWQQLEISFINWLTLSAATSEMDHFLCGICQPLHTPQSVPGVKGL